MPWTSEDPAHLSRPAWQWASDHLPIACVDILPVVPDADGRPALLGLIERHSPFGRRWCHLGGRVVFGETLREAALRHLRDTLDPLDLGQLAERPFTVTQYFREPRPGFGHDPRKHAIATCFTASYRADAEFRPAHEALGFRRFDRDALPDQLWPGVREMLADLP